MDAWAYQFINDADNLKYFDITAKSFGFMFLPQSWLQNVWRSVMCGVICVGDYILVLLVVFLYHTDE